MTIRIPVRETLAVFLFISAPVLAQTQADQGPETPPEQIETQQTGGGGAAPPAPAPPPCTCYCLVNWGAAIAAPHVPTNTFTTTNWFALPPTQTETEDGDEFWDANTNKKDYNCATKQVTLVTPDTPNLVHNTYRRTRSRTLGFTGWGAWTAWTAPANTGNLANAAALATSAPPQTPVCTAQGVPCP